MKAFYNDTFVLPLPENHRFPMQKYARLRQRLQQDDRFASLQYAMPPAASDEQLLRCHQPSYLQKLTEGTLSRREQVRIGFPWSPAMVERSRRSTDATIAAARTALTAGAAVNLAGGTHHASPDHGEGYSVFNDAAVAARTLQAESLVQHVLIVDCDVHQGNGTAAIFRDDTTVFTFSMHGERNFPFRKVYGDLDIGLPDHTADAEYLYLLEIALERAFFAAQPDLVIYTSGADPYSGDRLGKLDLSKAGLVLRDRMVLSFCAASAVPVAVTMGGGYAPNIEDIVDIHVETIHVALGYADAWRRTASSPS